MSSTVALGRRRRHDLSLADGLPADERWIRRSVGLAWGLLTLNVLTFYSATWSGLPLAFPIPSAAGKMITQCSLAAAMLVAISVTRRLVIRPSVFLFIVSLLVVVAFAVILEPGHFGTIYRTLRFTGFVATLSVAPQQLAPIVSVTLSPATGLPNPSRTCAFSGIAAPEATLAPFAGSVVSVLLAGAPELM